MKNPVYKIQIPEPCHEDWNNMQPDAKGRFCNSCSKSVVDFSNMSDTQIQDYLLRYKDQKVCGHFKSTQVNRPLTLQVDLNKLPANMSVTRQFTLALLLVFGSLLFSCTDYNGQVVGKLELRPTTKGEVEISTVQKTKPVEAKDTSIQTETLQVMTKGDVYMNEITVGQVAQPVCESAPGSIQSVDPGILPPDSIPAVPVDSIPYLIMGGIGFVEVPQDTLAAEPPSIEDDQTPVAETIAGEPPELAVYPNPATGEFNIRYTVLRRSAVKLSIFDVNGSLIKSLVNLDNQYEGRYTIPVSLEGLSSGVYVVNLINEGKRYTEKIVLER